MKASVLSVLTLLILSVASFAQTNIAPYCPNAETRLWGFMNEKGEEVIPAIYDEVLEFSNEGATLVRKGKVWSVINKANEEIVVEVKGFAPMSIFGFGKRGFSGGLLVIAQSKLQGVIDTKGKVIHDFKYTTISDFENGVATAKIGNEFFVLKSDGASTPVPDVIDLDYYKDGFIPFQAKTKLFGYINVSGKEVIAPTYKAVGYFSNGLAWVKNADGTVGFVDNTGKIAIEAKFLAAKEFDKIAGVARVKLGAEWMYLHKDGETFSPKGATGLGDFSDGLAYAKMGEKVGYVNAKGEWAIEAKFDKARDFQDGFAAVRVGEVWGVINKKGEYVCEPKFHDIKNFSKVK
jgi:hypothetical protein